MYITRFLEKELNEYLNVKEIIAITGPRQCGKTTLMKHIFNKLQNALFLDFEDRETLDIFNYDIKNFVNLYVKKYDYLFIDEFQYAKEGGKNLKYIYDNFKTKIIISGSSVSGLSIHGLKYLVGRVFIFNLHPLSFGEFLNYKSQDLYDLYIDDKLSEQIINKIVPFFTEFCIFGGYPRVVLAKTGNEKEIILRNIYNTYFLKEIKEILNIPEDYKLSRLTHALALQIGNIINYNELSNLTDLKYLELKKYINTLEKTFISIICPPYFTNKRIELAKAPKIFFFDNGFRNIVIKNFQELKNRQDAGCLYENFVASEIIKSGLNLKYWRTKSKAEVDFIIESKKGIFPIEIKSNLRSFKIEKSLKSFIDKYHPDKIYVLSESFNLSKGNINFRPIFLINKIVS